MKLIIPMAGRGTRLRPHTHVTPKPLMPVMGASMVERIVTTFIEVLPKKLDEAVFVLGDFPPEVNEELTQICERHGVTARFANQDVALGTAHAIHCAAEFLEGEIITVFADTLFLMEPGVQLDADVIAWVKHVPDPRRFGVVVRDASGKAIGFVEKPKEIISTEALIGIYYVKEGEKLRDAIQYLMDNELSSARGEYELTDAYDKMLKDGATLETASVTHWLDCGTIQALHETTRFMLNISKQPPKHGNVQSSVIIEPVYIGPNVEINRSIVGPFVSLEAGAIVADAIVRDSIVFSEALVQNTILEHSMVGKHARIKGQTSPVNIGDHSSLG